MQQGNTDKGLMAVQLVAICKQQDKRKKAETNIFFLKFTFMFSILNKLLQYYSGIKGLDFAVTSLILQG